MIKRVVYSRRAQKDIKAVPLYIATKLFLWAEEIEKEGLEKVRKIPGYHDEPLKGERMGQRSLRLNRAYRAIYIIGSDNNIKFVSIEEINKHEY